jgi:hypothetical protein
MDDKWAGDEYAGREGTITQVGIDPFGDAYLVGTWGSLNLYPKVDIIKILG